MFRSLCRRPDKPNMAEKHILSTFLKNQTEIPLKTPFKLHALWSQSLFFMGKKLSKEISAALLGVSKTLKAEYGRKSAFIIGIFHYSVSIFRRIFCRRLISQRYFL